MKKNRARARRSKGRRREERAEQKWRHYTTMLYLLYCSIRWKARIWPIDRQTRLLARRHTPIHSSIWLVPTNLGSRLKKQKRLYFDQLRFEHQPINLHGARSVEVVRRSPSLLTVQSGPVRWGPVRIFLSRLYQTRGRSTLHTILSCTMHLTTSHISLSQTLIYEETALMYETSTSLSSSLHFTSCHVHSTGKFG